MNPDRAAGTAGVERRARHGGAARWGAAAATAAFLSPVLSLSGQASPEPGVTIDRARGDFLEWRSLGPLVGGRSIAAAGSVARPLEYYFGATGGGLWKTRDGGVTWNPVGDEWLGGTSVGSVGICEANPDVVYVGTGEGQFRGTMSAGDGVWGSRDGGRSWTHLGLGSGTGQTAVPRIRVHPDSCERVYAAVLGDPYGPNPERGVYRSDDAGRSWSQVLFRNELAGASDLSMDATDPAVLYATIWDVHRPPWGGRTNGTSGIFKSVDAGDSWTEITRNPGLPDTIIGKSSISVSAADPDRVYAVIEAEVGHGGVYRSDDAGATWSKVNGNNALFHRAEYYIRVVADPQDPDRVYVLNKNFFRSDDGGRSYRLVRVPHGDNHDLWIDPTDHRRMIQANDGGGVVSWNAGQTWTGQQYPTPQMYHVFVTRDFPYLVCGAQQDNSAKCVPSDSDGSFYYQGAGGEQGYIAVDPTRSTLGYGGSQRGGLWRFDRVTGQRQNVQVWPRQSDGFPAGEIRERFQWTFPIVMSPRDPTTLYAASQHVWRTTNAGRSWQRISDDLTRAAPETLTGSQQPIKDHNSQDYYATIFSLAVSPHDASVLWVGSDDGLVHVTRDGGDSWSEVTPAGLPEFAKISLITISPHRRGSAYLAAERYKLQDVTPHIFRTDDYGRTWTRIVQGIPEGHFVRAVHEDPVRPGLLFAGTERGPYVSFDDGDGWVSLRLGLPAVQVPDLEVAGNDLVIATYGRGFYLMEDISPLRTITPAVLTAAAHLFEPADVIRTRAGPAMGVDGRIYGRTRIPGTNRLHVDYALGRDARSVRVEILDARGSLVRSYAGPPGDAPAEPVRNSVGHVVSGPGWGSATPDAVVPVERGLHRFHWDLRYPPATDFVGMRLRGANADGPYAPPGTYTVRLTVDGTSQEASFRVLKDPRLVEVSDADLLAQFELAARVHELFDVATSTVLRIRSIESAVTDRLERSSDAELQGEGTELHTRLHDAELTFYQSGAEAQSDLKHLGTSLTNHLAHLKGVIMSADARPTEQSQAVLDEISQELGARLAELEQLLATELVRFNQMLRERGLPPIDVVVAE